MKEIVCNIISPVSNNDKSISMNPGYVLEIDVEADIKNMYQVNGVCIEVRYIDKTKTDNTERKRIVCVPIVNFIPMGPNEWRLKKKMNITECIDTSLLQSGKEVDNIIIDISIVRRSPWSLLDNYSKDRAEEDYTRISQKVQIICHTGK